MTTASLLARAHDGVVDEPDPAARPRRRSFTPEYKEQILAEYDALPAGSTERGALLRREGLYTSHIAEWRKARDAGAREGLAPKAKPRRSPEQAELEKLRRRNERLEAELERTKTALEITGKSLIESTNTKLRLLARIAYGFKEPEHLIALALLDRGGYCPALPGRSAR